jgi:hypothetical protein
MIDVEITVKRILRVVSFRANCVISAHTIGCWGDARLSSRREG